DFHQNPALCQAVKKAVSADRAVHIFGLLSPGGIHSHERHIAAMVELSRRQGATKIFIHAFLDGRDTPPRSALASLQAAEKQLLEAGCGRVASLVGRFYAMDRDNRWDRTQQAYELLTEGKAEHRFANVTEALQAAYARDEDDEFVAATVIADALQEPVCIEEGDAVVFMNFRADRARQLTRAFVESEFSHFVRNRQPGLADFVTLTEYAADIDASCAYPPQPLPNVFGEYVANQGKTQLRIAETEKYAHVTFFFNGGREEPFRNEERILVPSPQVKTYDLKPEMSAPEVTDKLVDAIMSGRFDAIICNYANGDMVGHTGDFDASVKAVEAVDQCVGRLVAALRETDGQMLVTADHGNVEQMMDESSGQPLTSHTSGPVPLVYVGPVACDLAGDGSLADIAPTLLELMKLPLPAEMTGRSLLLPAGNSQQRASN
ncbi:MAG: 2,3-bisphosphoglycerate-independent phosphoglycerate mutase, partial [Pseudohongiellaceae bacterium]